MILQTQNIPFFKKSGRRPCGSQSKPNSLLLCCHKGGFCFFRNDLLVVIECAIQVHGDQLILHTLPHKPRDSLQHRQVNRVKNIEKVFHVYFAPLSVVQKQHRYRKQRIVLNSSQIRAKKQQAHKHH